MPSGDLSHSAQRVQDALATHGVECQVLELPETTRTAVGTPFAVFSLTPDQLLQVTDGSVVSLD